MASAEKLGEQDHLTADDFPLQADRGKIKRQDGKPVAQTESEDMAKEIAERLNCEEHSREEDKWSA
jgi:hypothetical protein